MGEMLHTTLPLMGRPLGGGEAGKLIATPRNPWSLLEVPEEGSHILGGDEVR